MAARNARCACGSGRKQKHCCGTQSTVPYIPVADVKPRERDYLRECARVEGVRAEDLRPIRGERVAFKQVDHGRRRPRHIPARRVPNQLLGYRGRTAGRARRVLECIDWAEQRLDPIVLQPARKDRRAHARRFRPEEGNWTAERLREKESYLRKRREQYEKAGYSRARICLETIKDAEGLVERGPSRKPPDLESLPVPKRLQLLKQKAEGGGRHSKPKQVHVADLKFENDPWTRELVRLIRLELKTFGERDGYPVACLRVANSVYATEIQKVRPELAGDEHETALKEYLTGLMGLVVRATALDPAQYLAWREGGSRAVRE